MKYKFFFPVVCLVLCMSLFLFCKAKRVKPKAAEAQEQSAFYSFSALRDTVKRQTSFTLKNVTVANAKIKYNVDDAKTKLPSYLKIEIIDKNNKTVLAFAEHPLFKRMEVFNESGQIDSKLISLQEGEFTLRVPYFEAYKKIKITEVINFKESLPILLKNEN